MATPTDATASPTEAATTLEAWRQDNFGWMTPAENRTFKALIARLTRQASRVTGVTDG